MILSLSDFKKEFHYWDAIASKEVRLSQEDAELLSNDAQEAGLCINFVPSLSITQKF